MELNRSLATLHAFTTTGGTIDVGRIDIIDCAAVASDANTIWVILTRREGEGLLDLLSRLNHTLQCCLERNERVDEFRCAINRSLENPPPAHTAGSTP
jgi:hypothetical protein